MKYSAALILSSGLLLTASSLAAAPVLDLRGAPSASSVEEAQYGYERTCRRLARDCRRIDGRGDRADCRRYRRHCTRWWR